MFARLFRTLKLWLAFALTALLILFAIVNREFIEISLFPMPYVLELPKFLIAIICFGAGLMVGGILMSRKTSRVRRNYKHEQKRTAALENEVKSLHHEQLA